MCVYICIYVCMCLAVFSLAGLLERTFSQTNTRTHTYTKKKKKKPRAALARVCFPFLICSNDKNNHDYRREFGIQYVRRAVKKKKSGRRGVKMMVLTYISH